jgi:glyoxylase-like metal-dependent hydrolase (beta-lactamase superfamily II)
MKTKQLTHGVYLLNEYDSSNCYLVIGEEKALLIDCGLGFCDLKGEVEKLCDKPLTVVATHGHVDHIGGAGQFGRVYIHPLDTALLNRIQTGVFLRKLFLSMSDAVKKNGFTKKDIIRYPKPEFLPAEDGYTFDLGGRMVTVHHTPGHTRGSIALVLNEDKFVFSGDNVCDALWMHLPGATTLEEWLPGAKWLYEISKTHRVFWGHRVPELKTQYIAQVIHWGEEILKNKNSLLPKTKQFPKQSDGILYKTNKIHKR